MKLSEWLEELPYQLQQGNTDTGVEEVVYDSRKAGPGTVFVCMRGANVDSHRFIPQAVAFGCRVICAEHSVEAPGEVTVILVKDGRDALARLSAARFGYPARKLVMIGITGTKGKTTTTYMIKSMLEKAGHKTGLIGTNGIVIGDTHVHTENTTPESYILHRSFARMVEEGCEYCVMEVSSQSYKMRRVDGIHYDYAAFMNISRDHIGPNEHKDFDEYIGFKKMLLQNSGICLVNLDDSHFAEIVQGASARVYSFSMERQADFYAEDIAYVQDVDFTGVAFTMNSPSNLCVAGADRAVKADCAGDAGCAEKTKASSDMQKRRREKIRVSVPGGFTVSNALAAAGICAFFSIDQDLAVSALTDLHINGRMEIVHRSPRCTVIVDYAHNAVSMESLLTTLREYHPKRLVCVFGCGGNRARDRRFDMGEIGGRLADLNVITADNSRFEKVEDILADIRTGLARSEGKYVEIPDRREAIRWVLENAREGDLIAVIGKGHEDYQEIEGVRHHFSDQEEIRRAAAELQMI